MIGPVSSLGGPYIVLPETIVNAWPGAAEAAAYEEICRGPDKGRVARIAERDAVILGTPDPLYFLPKANGGVLVRVVSFDADDDDALAEILQEFPEESWEQLGVLQVVDNPYLAFDSAMGGGDAASDALSIDLSRGSYAVTSTTFMPDDETELLLTRLQRQAE